MKTISAAAEAAEAVFGPFFGGEGRNVMIFRKKHGQLPNRIQEERHEIQIKFGVLFQEIRPT